jgi:hypothetical protein
VVVVLVVALAAALGLVEAFARAWEYCSRLPGDDDVPPLLDM